jgi:hypothetical protein
VSHGDTGICRRRNGAGDAGNYYKWNIKSLQIFCFFSAAAEDERISAFETDDSFAFEGACCEDFVDLLLIESVLIGLLAYIRSASAGAKLS